MWPILSGSPARATRRLSLSIGVALFARRLKEEKENENLPTGNDTYYKSFTLVCLRLSAKNIFLVPLSISSSYLLWPMSAETVRDIVLLYCLVHYLVII